MSSSRPNASESDSSRKVIFIAVGLAGAALIALLVYWATRPAPPAREPHLEGAIRADSPEFAQWRPRVVVDFIPDQDAVESTRAAGDIVMAMRPKVRNFSGRTINGLELKATVVDLDGKPVRSRTVIAIPNAATSMTELEPNKVLEVPIMMEGFKPTDVRANIRIEMTAVRFK
ncbi:MAG: hypothetical protein QOF61_2166 [Acidobacteriota bacterium]|jgi:hypothetical protein|nr:hypothetical protein [Acidobacteriota bacterium]